MLRHLLLTLRTHRQPNLSLLSIFSSLSLSCNSVSTSVEVRGQALEFSLETKKGIEARSYEGVSNQLQFIRLNSAFYALRERYAKRVILNGSFLAILENVHG